MNISDQYERYKIKCEKIQENNILINILIWNCQRINKKLGRSDIRINFLKDILYLNELDIMYLIVENFRDGIFLIGCMKYDDGRNILLDIDELKELFEVDKDKMIVKNN